MDYVIEQIKNPRTHNVDIPVWTIHSVTEEELINFESALRENTLPKQLRLNRVNRSQPNTEITTKIVVRMCEALHFDEHVFSLELSRLRMKREACEALGELFYLNTKIKTLSFVDMNTPEMFKLMMPGLILNSTLKQLILRKCGIMNSEYPLLYKMMKFLDTLRLNEVPFSSRNCKYLAKGIEKSETLVYLDMNKCRIVDPYIIGHAIATSQSLRTLNIADCESDLNFIFYSLRNNKSITKISFTDTSGEGKDMKTLLESVKINDTLYRLCIYGGISDQDLKQLFTILQDNETLGEVDISCYSISQETMTTLSECLRVNHTLTSLSLYSNGRETFSGKIFTDIISNTTCLRHLNINVNVESKDVDSIHQALLLNETFTGFCLNNVYASYDITRRNIENMRKKNQTLFDMLLSRV